MHVELVVDASVVGAAFFSESFSQAAQRRLAEDVRFIAPDLLRVEMASIASKKIRRGDATGEEAARALGGIGLLVSEFISAEAHYRRACDLAAQHGISAYDGLYLAIAEARTASVLTADQRLVSRATTAGLSSLIEAL